MEAFAESMLDLAITSLASLHDLKKTSGQRNSRTGRYIYALSYFSLFFLFIYLPELANWQVDIKTNLLKYSLLPKISALVALVGAEIPDEPSSVCI